MQNSKKKIKGSGIFLFYFLIFTTEKIKKSFHLEGHFVILDENNKCQGVKIMGLYRKTKD